MQTLRFGNMVSALVVIVVLTMARSPGVDQPSAYAAGQNGEMLIVAEDYAFIPAFVTVRAGTTVRWTNRDPELHTITSDEGIFDGSLEANETISITFREPGVFFYYCQPHDWMIGEVTVVATQPTDPGPAEATPAPARSATPQPTASRPPSGR